MSNQTMLTLFALYFSMSMGLNIWLAGKFSIRDFGFSLGSSALVVLIQNNMADAMFRKQIEEEAKKR